MNGDLARSILNINDLKMNKYWIMI